MQADRDSFRKMGLTFEEKAFYDILMALRDKYNFEYGEDKLVDGVVVNEKCKSLAKEVTKEESAELKMAKKSPQRNKLCGTILLLKK